MRRALWETLVDLTAAATPAGPTFVRVTDLYVDLPIEIRVGRGGPEAEIWGDVPRWRWTTVFDDRCGRLKIRWAEGVI